MTTVRKNGGGGGKGKERKSELEGHGMWGLTLN